jgi:NADH-quinone oxidoreductase subunit A
MFTVTSSAAIVLLLYACATFLLIAAMLGASYLLGGVRTGRAMIEPFESGILPVGPARLRLPVQYYVIGMFFVIFDMEAVFVFSWAIVVRPAGWTGYVTIVVFLGVLLATFAYLWRVGALEWGPRPRPASARSMRIPETVYPGPTA